MRSARPFIFLFAFGGSYITCKAAGANANIIAPLVGLLAFLIELRLQIREDVEDLAIYMIKTAGVKAPEVVLQYPSLMCPGQSYLAPAVARRCREILAQTQGGPV